MRMVYARGALQGVVVVRHRGMIEVAREANAGEHLRLLNIYNPPGTIIEEGVQIGAKGA